MYPMQNVKLAKDVFALSGESLPVSNISMVTSASTLKQNKPEV